MMLTQEEEDYSSAIVKHHDVHERIPALFEVFADIEPATFWRVLRRIIPITPHFGTHQEILRRMMSSDRCENIGRIEAWYETDFHWMKRAAKRRKPLKVYRGGSQVHGLSGFNWTTNYNRAKAFAELSGFSEATITVGRMDPRKALLPIYESNDIFTFPEYVETERVDTVIVHDPLLVRKAQILAVGAIHGSATVMDTTPGAVLREAIENGKRDKEKAIAQLNFSRTFLERLGFKKRLETIDAMLKEIEHAVRSA